MRRQITLALSSLIGIAMLLSLVAASEPPSQNSQVRDPESPHRQTEMSVAHDALSQWPYWRGPWATGVAPLADPPITWSDTHNVRWRARLPGLGHSTPVVWGDRIYLTTAIPVGEKLQPRYDNAPGSHDNLPVTYRYQFVVLAVDRTDGTIAWQTVVREAIPHEGGHYSGSLASASAVTDGQHVYASFGSHGLYCLDLDGQMVWKTDLGTLNTLHAHGEGASPFLFDHTLIVNCDHEGDSFVVAFDAQTGRETWRVARDEVTSWSSPIVTVVDGAPQVVVSGTHRIRGYALDNGEVIWECGGLSSNVVASPVAGNQMLFAASSYDYRAILAIRMSGAHGDITGSARVAWTRTRSTPYVPSPLLYGEWIYYLRHYQGVLSRLRAATGEEPLGPFRLGPLRDIYASPVGAAGRVYITDRDGMTVVIGHDGEPEILAVNQLRDTISASAAVTGNELFLRGERYLYCLANQPDRSMD